MIDNGKLRILFEGVKFKRTNQSYSSLKISQSTNLYDAHLTEVTNILKFLNDLKNNKKKKQKQNRKQEKLWSFNNSTNVLFGRKI